ncbi:MAG TPA: alpha/beta hydrolase fold domain-containing protein [Solirubrobacterales bacterium]
MASPRLPKAVEYRLVRKLCALPPRVQRRLFGRPAVIDGQELATDIHVLLRLADVAGDNSLLGGLPPVEARAYVRDSTAATAGTPLPMAELHELEYPGAAGPLAARLYVPLGAEPAPRPTIVFFHGGGWVVGDLDTHDSVCRFLAAHSGAAVLSARYRLAPEHPFPAAVEDAEAAFRWAVANAEELGADPARLAVGGDSAGGNLAAGVCLAMRDSSGPRPALQVLNYPAVDAIESRPSRQLFADHFILTQRDIETCERHYLPDKEMGYDPRASILRTEDLSGLPPAYVATAGFDPLRDEGEEYAMRMREAGVTVALRRHPRLIHTYANLTGVSRSARAAMLEMAGAVRMGLAAELVRESVA